MRSAVLTGELRAVKLTLTLQDMAKSQLAVRYKSIILAANKQKFGVTAFGSFARPLTVVKGQQLLICLQSASGPQLSH
jgi:hypothetical protein